MATKTISMRLPQHEVKHLDQLARKIGTKRADFLRQALQRGAVDLMFEYACQSYRDGEATLSLAAEMAGLSQQDLMRQMRNTGLELNYGVDDLARDLQT